MSQTSQRMKKGIETMEPISVKIPIAREEKAQPRIQKPTEPLAKTYSKSNESLKERPKKVLEPIKPQLVKKPSVGPRLGPDTLFDRETVYAESRRRVKELAQQMRIEVQQRANSPSKRETRKKSVPELPRRTASQLDMFQKMNSRLGSNNKLDKYSKQMKEAFGSFLAPDELEMLSGEVGYTEELMKLMGEATLEEKEDPDTFYDSIKVSGLQKPKREHPTSISTDALQSDNPTSLADLDRNMKSYDRLMSKIQVAPRTLVPVVNSIASDNENSPTKGFLNDFEMLLNLQLKLENEALSTLSMMDCSNSAKAIGRLSKEEVCQLVWNIFQHLHSAEKKLISEETARLVHGIISEAKSEIQYAQQIKALFRTLPRDVFLEIKSISGHLKRISLILNDNKIGIRNFIKSMSNLLGPLVFKTLFKLPVVYQPPSLEVGKSFPIINMDDDLSDFEDELPFKHLESQQSQMGMNLPKTPMSTQMVLSPGVVDLGESYGNLDSDEYEDDGSDDNFYRQSRGASARFNHAFSFDIMDTRQETEDRLRDSLGQLNKNELESFLFQQHLCMTWYGYTLELLVRYWDYIFEKFEIGANKMA